MISENRIIELTGNLHYQEVNGDSMYYTIYKDKKYSGVTTDTVYNKLKSAILLEESKEIKQLYNNKYDVEWDGVTLVLRNSEGDIVYEGAFTDKYSNDRITSYGNCIYYGDDIIIKFESQLSDSLLELLQDHLTECDDDCIYHEIIHLNKELRTKGYRFMIEEYLDEADKLVYNAILYNNEGCKHPEYRLTTSELFKYIDLIKNKFKISY